MTTQRLIELHIGDAPEAWAAAGFSVTDGATQVGHVRFQFAGPDEPRGIRSWTFDKLDQDPTGEATDLDGVPTRVSDEVPPAAPVHSNGVDRFDHVVLMSPDGDRTTGALTAAGFEVRGTREYEIGSDDKGKTPMRQTFFWMGDVILELVGKQDVADPGPAKLWGLAFTCTDLDATVASLGEHSSEARTAVQPGRRIASLRHKALDITVPIAFMSPHVNPKSA